MIVNIIYVVCLFIVLISIFILLCVGLSYNDKIYPKKNKKPENICFLLPARNESNVIRNLLESIKNQDYSIDMKDVYVIVESSEDLTTVIAEYYGATIVVREKLHLKSKGYALMEAVEKIYSQGKHYDMYFIFDADNTLDKSFVSEMVKSYIDGYDYAIGYRKSNNFKTNRITISSTLVFSILNDFSNHLKEKKNKPVVASGTGYYISGKILDKYQTWPWHLLTEDYEFSIDALLDGYISKYNKKAIYYDEQPTSYKVSVVQRTRWCKGYQLVRKKRRKELRRMRNKNAGTFTEFHGIKPLLLLMCAVAVIFINSFIGFWINVNNHESTLMNLIIFISIPVFTYLFLQIISLYLIIKNKKEMNIGLRETLIGLFYFPLFFLTFIPCYINAIKQGNEWIEIKHEGDNK